MGTITLTITRECDAGDHWNISVTGDYTGDILGVYVPDLLTPITDTEKEEFFKVLLRLAKIGRTNDQLRNVLNAGYTITI
jgi:hypothetical protein